MKPTLQEIADMNHSEGVLAMREHYDPQWPMVTAEREEMTNCDACGEEVPLSETEYGVCFTCLTDDGGWF